MKITTVIGQIIISVFTTVIVIHLVVPIYIKDTVSEIECEREDRQIIQSLCPSLPMDEYEFLPHNELHNKREQVEAAYYRNK